jgi:hypothetical protein
VIVAVGRLAALDPSDVPDALPKFSRLSRI